MYRKILWAGMKQFDSRLVARYIIYHAKEKGGIHMNFTMTHKLLYILDGAFLWAYNRQILNERPRVWEYGPAYPKVQYMMKKTYPEYLGDFEPGFDDLKEVEGMFHLTDKILDLFGCYSSSQLADWTSQYNSPWAYTLNKHKGKYNYSIQTDTMTDYFSTVFVRN